MLQTLITALAAVVMLGRRLAITQWVSLVILAAGVAMMQIGAISVKAQDLHGHAPVSVALLPDSNYLAGISAVLVSCFCSSIAATYFELVIKRRVTVDDADYQFAGPRKEKPASLWTRNIQLSLFSLIFGVAVVVVQANANLDFSTLSANELVVDPLSHWYDPIVRSTSGFFSGFRPIVWAVVILQSFGGLLIGNTFN